jgi:tRNA uridine 5-carboxymethylaminomethyl modification enzyme
MLVRSPSEKYDVIVIGGGHAGIEASLASARLHCHTLLISLSSKSIGRLSCNPAIGGTAKGHLVREIDALGGEMGKIADVTGIQFKMLNKSKGPAVWSPRSQNDRELYAAEATKRVLNQSGLDALEDSVCNILIEDKKICGVRTFLGFEIKCKCLVICAGTFLNGLMHTGLKNRIGGRFGEPPSKGITESLKGLGFVSGRLKTGTPPRIDYNSIDFKSVELQESDNPPIPFSYQTDEITNKLIPMYLTHTNEGTHKILEKGFDRSPMFTGKIKGIGPRYCPSIEDKIFRFADRNSHQIFLEPEGYNTNVVYVNGFSTSLPEEIQYEGLRTIRGLENVNMLRAGYAVEYDFFPPNQLKHSLETKIISGLFFAGQINGTSGYEEAAGQGLIAGVNAANIVLKRPPIVLRRSQAYIGVMIDDLINKSTDEPYRMFTSRAEHRLLLRQDNADRRLMGLGHSIGLINDDQHKKLLEKERRISSAVDYFNRTFVHQKKINLLLDKKGEPPVAEPDNLSKLLKRSSIKIGDLRFVIEDENILSNISAGDVAEQVEIDLKYEGYISRELDQISRFTKFEEFQLSENFDYSKIRSLSNEGRERLQKIKPRSLGQASRISGVTTSDISVLAIYIRRSTTDCFT